MVFLSLPFWIRKRALTCEFSFTCWALKLFVFTDPASGSISGQMTGALVIYSATFMRYSLAVTPRNFLLFGCHFVNECAQLTQGYRYLSYHNWGGKEKMDLEKNVQAAKDKVEDATDKVKDAAKK